MPERVTRKDEPLVEIQQLTAEVWRRVQEWHDSPDWQDNERNRDRYDVTARAATAVNHPLAPGVCRTRTGHLRRRRPPPHGRSAPVGRTRTNVLSQPPDGCCGFFRT